MSEIVRAGQSVKPKDECGVIGIYNPNRGNDQLPLVYEVAKALPTLQHRGQQSAGIGGESGGRMIVMGGLDKVERALSYGAALRGLDDSNFAMGHVRYATSLLVANDAKSKSERMMRAAEINTMAIQPMPRFPVEGVSFMLGVNGNCANAGELLAKLQELKPHLNESEYVTDTAIVSSLISQRIASGLSIREALLSVTSEIVGAYSMVVWGKDREGEKLYALKDPNGFRPLMLGALPNNGWMVASEEGALIMSHAEFDSEIPAGHMVEIGSDGLFLTQVSADINPTTCIFEDVYLARPDQRIHNVRTRLARIRAGELLAREHPVDADVVVGVPDSGLDAARGYARELNLRDEDAFVRNRYNMDRSFLGDSQEARLLAIELKISSVIPELVRGLRVAIVDDSLVRSNTARYLVQLVRDAGATEVHVRLASDKILHRCLYGVDMPDESELVAAHMSVEEIAVHINADSLGYLQIENLRESTGSVDRDNRPLGSAALRFCDACMTGNYPTPIPAHAKSL